MTITTKEAVALAKKTVMDLFGEDNLLNVALEEIDRNEAGDEWLVTIGFSRPWDSEGLAPSFISNRKREYKVVRLVGDKFKSVKNRELSAA